MNDLYSSEPTCVCDDDVSTGVLWMTSAPLYRPVYMMMTSVREFYEGHHLLWTYLWTWWWRKYGSFIKDLASSEPTCEHDDEVNTGILWMTSPPLNRPVSMMMTSVWEFSLLSSPPLNWPVYVMMTSVRESYEWVCLPWTDMWIWWWRQCGNFMKYLASSEPTCEHDDDVSMGV